VLLAAHAGTNAVTMKIAASFAGLTLIDNVIGVLLLRTNVCIRKDRERRMEVERRSNAKQAWAINGETGKARQRPAHKPEAFVSFCELSRP
jgi:hypothetical protein